MVQTVAQLANQINQEIRVPPYWLPNHPLVKAIQKGSLGQEQLRRWGIQLYLLVREIGRVIGHVYGNCDDPEAKEFILWSFVEEETGHHTGTGPHADQLVRFLQGLGVTSEDLKRARPAKMTSLWIDWHFHIGRTRHFTEGLALFHFEQGMREAFGMIGDGLHAHYKLSGDAMTWWDVHRKQVAEERINAELAVFARYLTTEEAQASFREVAIRSTEAWWDVCSTGLED